MDNGISRKITSRDGRAFFFYYYSVHLVQDIEESVGDSLQPPFFVEMAPDWLTSYTFIEEGLKSLPVFNYNADLKSVSY